MDFATVTKKIKNIIETLQSFYFNLGQKNLKKMFCRSLKKNLIFYFKFSILYK